jgi:hypothetical protein
MHLHTYRDESRTMPGGRGGAVGYRISNAAKALFTATCRAIVARSCSRTSDYTIVQRYTPKRISYWFCRPTALELRGSQDERNAVCLRRAEW